MTPTDRWQTDFGLTRACRQSGLTPRAVRLYEEKGLIQPRRTGGGRRTYGRRELERLEFIALARRAGVGLRDIARFLQLEDSLGTEARDAALAEACRALRKVLEARQSVIAAILSGERKDEIAA